MLAHIFNILIIRSVQRPTHHEKGEKEKRIKLVQRTKSALKDKEVINFKTRDHEVKVRPNINTGENYLDAVCSIQ